MPTAVAILISPAAGQETVLFATPEEAVGAYITAVKTGSGAHVRMAFVPTATMRWYDQNGELQETNREEFAELVESGNSSDAFDSATSTRTRIEITRMLKTGHAANATLEFTFDERGKQGFVDYLNLIHDGTGWRLTDKVSQHVARD